VIAIPNVFITSEAEEMIRDASAGCGELDLVGVGAHSNRSSRRNLFRLLRRLRLIRLFAFRTARSANELHFPGPNDLGMLRSVHHSIVATARRYNCRMQVPVYVDVYSGFKANERPSQFVLDDEIYDIAAVLDQWYEPSATYFKVQSTVGKTYLLRYDEETDEWTLQSGFDGDELLTTPGIELVTVDSTTALKAAH
jgi:hypothetical protein